MAAARTLDDVFREICMRDGPLRERLEDFSAALRIYSLPFAEAYDALIAKLEAAEAGSGAPRVGEPMPPFLLPASNGRLVSLADLLVTGPVVVSFNRGHWCEYCVLELSALNRVLGELAGLGAAVISIMPESGAFTKSATAVCGNGVEVLSDMDNGYALETGLVIWLGDEVRTIYLEHGMHIETYQGSDAWFLPIPATFVVGRDGCVVARYVDPDFRRRMEVDDILAAVTDAVRQV